jgi:hypothetical protein
MQLLELIDYGRNTTFGTHKANCENSENLVEDAKIHPKRPENNRGRKKTE